MLITSKFESWCNRCGKVRIQVGDRCEWVPGGPKGVTCLQCLGTAAPSVPPPRARHQPDPPAPVAPVLPPALAAMEALEEACVRMAAKAATPAIDAAWAKYEKVKALALGRNVPSPEQRVALKTALKILIETIFAEESAYVI